MYFCFCSGVAAAISMCRFGLSGGRVKGTTVRHSSSLTAISATAGRLAPPNASGTSSAHRPSSLHLARSGASSAARQRGMLAADLALDDRGSSGISSLVDEPRDEVLQHAMLFDEFKGHGRCLRGGRFIVVDFDGAPPDGQGKACTPSGSGVGLLRMPAWLSVSNLQT